MKIAEAFVEVRADTTRFTSDLEGNARKSSVSAAKVIAGTFAAVGAGQFFKGAFSEFEEAQRSARQLEQTIRSTGGAAGVTAGYASDLADSISKASVVDDEVVAGAERILLTFKEIKNTDVDKTFDRATQAAIDLAAGLGGDAQSAALQLGKALNDPVRGLTLLQRAGISFTADQKELIKTLVATGETAQAQGIILSEVESQFGGQAAAAATEADRARIAFANLQESVGTALAPAFETAAKSATSLFEAFSAQPQVLQQVELLGGAAALAYGRFGDSIRDAAASFREFNSGATGAKAALGKAGIAGAATLAAVTLATVGRNARVEGLRSISSDVDKVSESLRELAATGEGDILGDLGSSFDTLGDKVRGFFDNPIFETSIVGSLFGGDASAAEDDIEAVDKALVNLIETGERATAQKAFRNIIEDQGLTAAEASEKFDDYAQALDDSRRNSLLAAAGIDEFGNEVEDTGPKVKSLADKLREYNDEIDRYLDQALSQEEAADRIAGGFNELAEAVEGVKAPEGKQTLIDFESNTPAALEYRDTIRGLVDDYAEYIKTTQATKAEGDLLAQSFYDQAIAAGVPAEEALKYTAILKGIPADAETEIRQEGMAKSLTDSAELSRRLGDVDGRTVRARAEVDNSQALTSIDEVRRALSSIANASAVANLFSYSPDRRASGGPLNDGLTLVGEEGPELLGKRGAQVEVLSAPQTRRALAGGGGSVNVTVNVHGFVTGSTRELASEIARLLEEL